VTELTARPLLRLFWPELAELRQPLAGELAARRSLLERIRFPTGYAIETTMLLDVHRLAGADAIAQVDLEVRQNAHQQLAALGGMASAVLEGAASRLRQEGRLVGLPEVSLVERPPLASLRVAA
jgi:glucosyl-3-phosphoglycerate synthase